MVACRSRWTGLFIGSVVPRFSGPGQGRGGVRDRLAAVLPEASIPDWLRGLHQHRDRAQGNVQKFRRRVRIAENLFRKSLQRPALARPDVQGFCVLNDRNLPIDDGDALFFSGQVQDQAQRSNRLPGDFSRRLIGSAVLRSRRDNA
jgi:hypothetical protein